MRKTEEQKSKMIVVALKLKTGEDIIGYFAGEMDLSFSGEKAVVLLRPIKIDTAFKSTSEGLRPHYIPSLYFPLSGPTVNVPLSAISHQGIAEEFFCRMYAKIVPELVALEAKRHESIIEAIELKECEDLISENCFLVYSDTHYIH